MAQLTTNNALRRVLYEEDYLLIWLKAGYTKDDRHLYRHRFSKDQLSLDKIEEILEKCGFTVAVEKKWQTPNLSFN